MALLTSKQLANALGFQVKFIRKLAQLGRIPAERYGSEWRFDLDVVRKAACYTDPISADAKRTARQLWMRPERRRI